MFGKFLSKLKIKIFQRAYPFSSVPVIIPFQWSETDAFFKSMKPEEADQARSVMEHYDRYPNPTFTQADIAEVSGTTIQAQPSLKQT